jgi:hypothetical protein
MYRYCWRTQYPWRSWRKHIKSIGIKQPAPQEFVAVNVAFGESGTSQLMEKYKLNNQAIVEAVEKSYWK